MKRWLLLLTPLLLLVAAVAVAPFLKRDPGLVHIQFLSWTIETSVPVILIILLLLFVLAQVLIWLWRMPGRTARRLAQKRAQGQLERGLLALTEGDWATAEKALSQSASAHGRSTAQYLAAARAAQGQADEGKRDAYLEQADTSDAKKRFLVELARAKMLVSNQDVGTAVPVLERLHKRRPKHPQVLELLSRSYRELGDWRRLRKLLPGLRKAGILDQQQVDDMQRLAAENELIDSADVMALQRHWKALPRTAKREPGLVAAFARRALELGEADAAEPVLRRSIDNQPMPQLLGLYADSVAEGKKSPLKQCEKWLKKHPDNPDLHLLMGQFCLDSEIWGQAKRHLQSSIQHGPSVQAYKYLGGLYDREGEIEASMQCYRNALLLAEGLEISTQAVQPGGPTIQALPGGAQEPRLLAASEETST